VLEADATPPRLFLAFAVTVCLVRPQVALFCELSDLETLVPVPRAPSMDCGPRPDRAAHRGVVRTQRSWRPWPHAHLRLGRGCSNTSAV